MSAWFHLDQPGKNRSRTVMERILVQEVAGGVWFLMILQRALVELLFATRHTDCQHVTPGTAVDHSADALKTRVFSAKVQGQIQSRRISRSDRGIHLDRDKVSAPLLNADVVQLGSRLQHEVIHSAGKSAILRVGRDKM